MHMIGGLRTNHLLTRIFHELCKDVDIQNEKKSENYSQSIRYGQSEPENQDNRLTEKEKKTAAQIQALLQIFFLSQRAYYKMQKDRSEIQISQTYETTKNMADQFNSVCGEQGRIGDFIYLSADPSLFSEGQQMRFSHNKTLAEDYLMNSCPNLRPVVLRPGKVYTGNWFNREIEKLPTKKNYTQMDAVVNTLFEEV